MKKVVTKEKNIVIVILGIIFAGILIKIIQSNEQFQASVLSLQEIQYLQDQKRDAAYKKEDQHIEIFLTPKLNQESELFLSLLYAKSLHILSEKITSPAHIEILHDTSNNIKIQIKQIPPDLSGNALITIPFTGEERDITVEYLSTSQNALPVALGQIVSDQISSL